MKTIKLVDAETLEGLSKESIELVDMDNNNTKKVDELKGFAGQMFQYCIDNKGEALSAVQIGILEQFFVMRTIDKEYAIVINPTYYQDGSRFKVIEGCLSYPNESYLVKRYRLIKVDFWTIHNNGFVYQRENMMGYAAEIFQHETDHGCAKTIAMIGKKV